MVQGIPFFGRFGQRGQGVLFVRPCAQVNQLAAFAAKGGGMRFQAAIERARGRWGSLR